MGQGLRLLAVLGLLWPLAAQSGQLPDADPLRRFVPDERLFMPLPAGRLAVTTIADDDASFEDKRDARHGGMVAGYCLKSSCRYVTHLVVEQVCGNRIGGAHDEQRLILGIVSMPYGAKPGKLLALRGRPHDEMFAEFGPYEEPVTEEADIMLKLTAKGMGAVAPLVFDGSRLAAEQPRDTVSLRLDKRGDLHQFEVRHYCRSPLS